MTDNLMPVDENARNVRKDASSMLEAVLIGVDNDLSDISTMLEAIQRIIECGDATRSLEGGNWPSGPLADTGLVAATRVLAGEKPPPGVLLSAIATEPPTASDLHAAFAAIDSRIRLMHASTESIRILRRPQFPAAA